MLNWISYWAETFSNIKLQSYSPQLPTAFHSTPRTWKHALFYPPLQLKTCNYGCSDLLRWKARFSVWAPLHTSFSAAPKPIISSTDHLNDVMSTWPHAEQSSRTRERRNRRNSSTKWFTFTKPERGKRERLEKAIYNFFWKKLRTRFSIRLTPHTGKVGDRLHREYHVKEKRSCLLLA